MGLIAAIIGWLQYHLGLRTDAASASGSLHAKIGELRNTVVSQIGVVLGTVQKPRTLAIGNYSIPSSHGQYTVLNVSGKGKLNGLRLYSRVSGHNSGDYLNLSVYVDGVLVASPQAYEWAGELFPRVDFFWPVAWYPSSGSRLGGWSAATDADAANSFYYNKFMGYLGIPFKTSLQIVAVRGGGVENSTLYWAYEYE
jgi:hypothetical protein